MGKKGDILYGNKQLGKFPLHHLKRVNKPTTLITDNISRIDVRENALNKSFRGDYGTSVQKATQRLNASYPISNAILDVTLGLRSLEENNILPTKAPIPNDPKLLSNHIKRLGYFLGADIMGICRLPQHSVYSHDIKGNSINLDYEFAIMIMVGKDYRTIKASSGSDWIIDTLSFQCYQRLAFMSRTISTYIRKLGYEAISDYSFKHRAGGMQALYPPLLLYAGIGEISRAGIVLNPFLGLATKAAAVFTNLPLEPDQPIDFGLQDFCKNCDICARACPGKAIPFGDKVMYNGYETWKLNEQRCASFSLLNKQGTFCGKCIHVCPWTRPTNWQNNMVRWMVSNSSLGRRLAIKLDTALNHREQQIDEKWWFDVTYIDGNLVTPLNK